MNTLLEKKLQVLSNIDIFNNIAAWRIANSAIFNTMRILKRINPADTYIDNYLGHYKKQGDKFLDAYHLMWWISSQWTGPKNILEIGCRTGISICQLLSAVMDYPDKKVFLFDVFNDGFITPELVTMNLKALNIPMDNVKFKIGDPKNTIFEFKQENPDLKFDYILVGSHEKDAAKTDLNNVYDMLQDGGHLLFDNIADGYNLQDVWDEFRSTHAGLKYFENYDGRGTGWAIKRIGGKNE